MGALPVKVNIMTERLWKYNSELLHMGLGGIIQYQKLAKDS